MIGFTDLTLIPTGGGSCDYGMTRVFREYSSSATWTKPANLVWLEVYCVGAGGGGGSGAKRASGVSSRGGGGGASGAIAYHTFIHDQLTSTVSVTIGSGGSGAAGIDTDSSAGSNGSNGGNTTFGSYVVAKGGGGGFGTGVGGANSESTDNTPSHLRHICVGISGASSNVNGFSNPAPSHDDDVDGPENPDFYNFFGSGGSGGGVTTANANTNGGQGSRDYNSSGTLSSGVSGGTAPGGNGSSGVNNYIDRLVYPLFNFLVGGGSTGRTLFPGTGGGGGAGGQSSNTGGDGGNGGNYGAGGGGGGGIRNGGRPDFSGNGGNGAGGMVFLVEHILLCTEDFEIPK